MAGSRKPGPIGLTHEVPDLNDGTLMRALAAPPGVIGTYDNNATSRPTGEPARLELPVATPERIAENRVIQSLQSNDQDFSVGGSRFRLIRADQLRVFRNDERYEVVARDKARQVLEAMAAARTISPAAKADIQTANSLLADTSARFIDSGLLLLRINRVRVGSTANREPPVTPLQIARMRAAAAASPPDESRRRKAPPPDQPSSPLSPILSFYEVVVLDELETAIAGIEVEITTPNGTQTLLTDDSGRVRVDDAPPGTGTAHIVSAQQLFDVLRDRVELDTRRTPLPQDEDLLVLTPTRVETSVSFPNAQTQRIMIVNRTDVVWGSVVEHWGDLLLLSEETDACRLSADTLTAMLKLSSTGAGSSALIGLPASGVRDDANLNITGDAITDRVDQNARLKIDIDALNEALFAADFGAVSVLIDPAADEPPPAPPPPDFPVPSQEGIDFAAELALLALQGNTDLLEVPEEQI